MGMLLLLTDLIQPPRADSTRPRLFNGQIVSRMSWNLNSRMEHVEPEAKAHNRIIRFENNSQMECSTVSSSLTAKMLENVTQLHKIEIKQLKLHLFR